jgi:hypothetical protein
MYEPVYRIKEWYKSVHNVGYFYYSYVSVATVGSAFEE